jgi:hypothetical protein
MVPLGAPTGGLVLVPGDVELLGVMAPGVVACVPDLALEEGEVDVFAVLVADVTGLMVVEDGLTTAGVGVLAGVGFGVGVAGVPGVFGRPGVAGLVVDGLAGTVEMVPGVGVWESSREAARDREASSMVWSPRTFAST